VLQSAEGKMRVDFGNTTMITDPAAQKGILLDHVKKEALTVHMPQGPQMTPPALPPGVLPTGAVPPQVVELGKALIEGHEVEGKQFTFQPPSMPKMPSMPQKPSLPQVPGMPAAPQMPQAPQMPTVAEVWTSTKTKLPVLTKVTGPFGQQICQCKVSETAPPPPAAFEIPPDYKQVKMPTPVKAPALQPPQIHRPTLPHLG
jgi:hypothetical protein